MKWKHKQMGWMAQTQYYDVQISKSVYFVYEAGGMKQTIFLPFDLVISDPNWEEIPDGRWLDQTFTVRDFMEGFAMVITEEAAGHDSVVAKGMVDRKIKSRYEQEPPF